MKKVLFSFYLIFTIGVFASQAQRSPRIGIRGGLNIANLNNMDGTDSRTGFMAGIYANFPIQYSPVSIQPEVVYTQKGYKSGGTTKLDYIQIPILAKFDFATDGSITPNVYLGPYVAFNVKATQKTYLLDAKSPEVDDIKALVESTGFGVVVGAGLNFTGFNLGVRYGAGLTDVFKNDDGKNGVLSIVAGIGF